MFEENWKSSDDCCPECGAGTEVEYRGDREIPRSTRCTACKWTRELDTWYRSEGQIFRLDGTSHGFFEVYPNLSERELIFDDPAVYCAADIFLNASILTEAEAHEYLGL